MSKSNILTDFLQNIGLTLHLDLGENPSVRVQIGGNGKRLNRPPAELPPSDDSDLEDQDGNEKTTT